MKKYVLIYGLIMGTILCVNALYQVNLCYTNPDFKSNDVLGYTALIVIFSLIFFGIRNYRNKQLDGVITFGKAFKMGAIIAFTSATMYVVVWLFYYYLVVPDFLDHYIPHVLKEASRNGATQAELAQKTTEMNQFEEMYQNPAFVVLTTYAEVLPIGLVVALISSLILKSKSGRGEAGANNFA
jgi:hypothetical protein